MLHSDRKTYRPCGMRTKFAARSIGLFAVVLFTASAFTEPVPPDEEGAQEGTSIPREVADVKMREYLNELSARRRVTTLFPNPQSPRWGLRENMVNTTRGNLTFLVRDLVRIDPMPIVFGRVYDSSRDEDDDFGPGWKLALGERIVRRGARLLYTDAGGTTHRLRLKGNRIIPVDAALTPVRTGLLRTGSEGRAIVLQSDDLIRRFKKIGNAFHLVTVSHQRGALHLTYQDGRLATVASKAGRIRIERRDDGRIIGARDDLGREISYAYDAAGRLHKVTDRTGGIWEYRYDDPSSGELAAMVDPRAVTILEASHHDGRVAWLRILRRETTFSYDKHGTKAVDVLGRTKVFHHGRSGLTEGIEDAAGDFTQIVFDNDLRPVTVMRNGEATARMRYDEEGRLAWLWWPDGETAYTHGGKGLIAVDGAATARYRYDDHGRVVYALDERGERAYAYDEAGGLAGLTMNGHELQLRTSPVGVITDVRRNGASLISHVIADDSRIASTVYGDGEGSRAVSYRYNQRGFREAATFSDGIAVLMHYDAAGNLIHISAKARDGRSETDDYEINAFNEVERIKSSDPAGPSSMSLRYDEAGRLYEMREDGHTLAVDYDPLDRITRIALDGEPLFHYDYEATDMDAATALDALSTAVAVPFGTSNVFGTAESIVYTRPHPMDYGPVVHAPEPGMLRVETAHLVPDAVLLSSLERRVMPLTGEPVADAPFGHDKPSNSLFIPPEYFSVNCHACSGWENFAPSDIMNCETSLSRLVIYLFFETIGGGGAGPEVCQSSFAATNYDSATGCCSLRSYNDVHQCNSWTRNSIPVTTDQCDDFTGVSASYGLSDICDLHDECYGDCNTNPNHKIGCDNQWQGLSAKRCYDRFARIGTMFFDCLNFVRDAHRLLVDPGIVNSISRRKFERAQREFCQCC